MYYEFQRMEGKMNKGKEGEGAERVGITERKCEGRESETSLDKLK